MINDCGPLSTEFDLCFMGLYLRLALTTRLSLILCGNSFPGHHWIIPHHHSGCDQHEKENP